MVAAAEEPPRRPRIPSLAEKRNNASPPSSSYAHNRRRSLHNFSFPPTLSWGNQRVLRCVNLASAGGGNLTASPTNNASNANKSESESESDPKPKPKRAEEEAESSPARPWNLRTRRANPNRISSSPANPSTNPQPSPSSNFNRSSSSSPSPPPPTILQVGKGNSVKTGRSEGEIGEESSGDKGERCKFAVALTRDEIEEDFVKMKGSKPPRRPKKRAKYIQRQLDLLFPGLWLSEITPDLYKIDIERP